MPDTWLESAGHHTSAEMSGRRSSLSGGHAVWRQKEHADKFGISAVFVRGQGQSPSDSKCWAQGLTAQENLGFAMDASWGQGVAGEVHDCTTGAEKERVVTRGGQGSGVPKRLKRRALSCSVAGKKGHRRLYPDRHPALEIDSHIAEKRKKHTSYSF